MRLQKPTKKEAREREIERERERETHTKREEKLVFLGSGVDRGESSPLTHSTSQIKISLLLVLSYEKSARAKRLFVVWEQSLLPLKLYIASDKTPPMKNAKTTAKIQKNTTQKTVDRELNFKNAENTMDRVFNLKCPPHGTKLTNIR